MIDEAQRRQRERGLCEALPFVDCDRPAAYIASKKKTPLVNRRLCITHVASLDRREYHVARIRP